MVECLSVEIIWPRPLHWLLVGRKHWR